MHISVQKPDVFTPSIMGTYIDKALCKGICLKDEEMQNYVATIDTNAWKEYGVPDKDTYTRHSIFEGKHVELLFVCWGAHVKTCVHDHAPFGCLMRILEGTLEEHFYNHRLEPVRDRRLDNGTMSYIDNDMGYHSIVNPSAQLAVSLHIYHPAGYQSQSLKEV